MKLSEQVQALWPKLWAAIVLLLSVFLVLTAAACLAELMTRSEMETFGRQKLDLLRSELLHLPNAQSQTTAPETPSNESSPPEGDSPSPNNQDKSNSESFKKQNNFSREENLRRQIKSIESGLDSLMMLRFVGATSLATSSSGIATAIIRSAGVVADQEVGYDEDGATGMEFQEAYISSVFSMYKFWRWPDLLGVIYMDSERIFGALVVVCGILGAILAGLRRTIALRPSEYVLGAITGFVTYLFLRGGKYVFLMSQKTLMFEFNPFTAALLALIGGLFSDKFYRLLTKLLDSLSRHVEKN